MTKNMLRCFRLLLSGIALLGLVPAQGQQIWPGDVNNNGIVNGVDLLWLGLAYGTDGPERPGATTLWQAQPLGAAWPQAFPNGLNYAYADCDGDGEADGNDLDDAILPNFRLTHGVLQPDGYANALPGTAPRLTLVPSTTLAVPGQEITIDVFLGSAGMPIGEFYGIAFSGSYNPELVDGGGTAVDFDDDDEWMAPEPDEPIEHLYYRDAPGGQYEVAFVRTNQVPVAGGFGLIGSFSIIVEDIIVGLSDTLVIGIDSIRLIDQHNNVYPVVPDTVRILVSHSSPTSTEAEAAKAAVQVYPNPVRRAGTFWITAPPSMRPLDISDALGRPVQAAFTPQAHGRWRLQWPSSTAPGWYVLRCMGPDGAIVVRPILVSP